MIIKMSYKIDWRKYKSHVRQPWTIALAEKMLSDIKYTLIRNEKDTDERHVPPSEKLPMMCDAVPRHTTEMRIPDLLTGYRCKFCGPTRWKNTNLQRRGVEYV